MNEAKCTKCSDTIPLASYRTHIALCGVILHGEIDHEALIKATDKILSAHQNANTYSPDVISELLREKLIQNKYSKTVVLSVLIKFVTQLNSSLLFIKNTKGKSVIMDVKQYLVYAFNKQRDVIYSECQKNMEKAIENNDDAYINGLNEEMKKVEYLRANPINDPYDFF